MSTVVHPQGMVSRVDDALITAELARRSSRPPDFQAENRALTALAQEMEELAGNPRSVLHKLVELALELCRADSAGVSILEPGGADRIFRWHAVAGAFAANLGGTMPREASPCGTVIARDSVLLFDRPERCYPALRGVMPRVHEALLAPWHVAGEAVGTLWVVSHSPGHEFDAEDARLVASLARFASVAYQMVTAVDTAETGRRELERRVEERTRALSKANEDLRREAVERARAQEALRESEARLQIAIEAADLGVWDLDLTTDTSSERSPRHDQMFGYSERQVEWGQALAERHVIDEDKPIFREAFAQAIEKGLLSFEVRVRWPDDSVHWIAPRGRTNYDDTGRPVRMAGVVADVTERKWAEKALRESEARFRRAIEEASIPVMMYAETGELLTMSRTVTQITGYRREELTSLDAWLERAYGEHAGEVEAIIQAYFKEGAAFPEADFTIRTAHGKERIWRFTASRPAHLANGRRYIVAFAMDVTEHRAATAALATSEARLRLALEAAELGAWDVDPAAGTVRCDPRCRTIFGIDQEAPLSVEEVMALVHPDDRQAARATFEQAIAPASAGSYAIEKRMVWPDSSVHWIVSKGRVHFAGEGAARRAVRMLGIAMDITERKAAEAALRRAKEAAERANAAKSRFLAAASHDLRQPLQALDLQRAVLARRVADREALQTLRELGLSVEVMRNTLDALLDLSQLETGAIKAEIVEFGLDDLFRRIVSEFRGLAAAKGLELKVVPSKAVVRSDPRLLERVLQNLVANAVKYTHTGKVLLGSRRRGGRLRVEVADTGIGIAPDQLEVIFEEFYQVANAARERRFGLGLGLSIAHAAAKLLGSTLEVRSVLGRGSSFALVVPFLRRAAARPTGLDEREPTGASASAATVLLVEDDAAIRDALRTLLELEGNSVSTAASGPEALALVRRGTCRPALAILDQNLPGGLSGVETVGHLRALTAPHLPAVVITGDVLPERLAALRAAGLPYLTKPVGADELQALVRSLAGRGASAPMASAGMVVPQPSPAAARVAAGPATQPTVHAIEDDAAAARSLQRLLAAVGQPVLVHPSAEAFLQAWHPGMAGCLVIDINLPGMSGLELQRELARRGSGLPCVFVTGRGELAQVVQAMREGAVDFLVKPVSAEALLASVEQALDQARHCSLAEAASAAEVARLDQLTRREREVVELVAAGLPNKDVAFRLKISQRTVDSHRAQAMQKLGVRTLPELVRLQLRSFRSR